MSSPKNKESVKNVAETKEAPETSEKNARKRSPEEMENDKVKSARSGVEEETPIIDKAKELGFKEVSPSKCCYFGHL